MCTIPTAHKQMRRTYFQRVDGVVASRGKYEPVFTEPKFNLCCVAKQGRVSPWQDSRPRFNLHIRSSTKFQEHGSWAPPWLRCKYNPTQIACCCIEWIHTTGGRKGDSRAQTSNRGDGGPSFCLRGRRDHLVQTPSFHRQLFDSSTIGEGASFAQQIVTYQFVQRRRATAPSHTLAMREP